MSDVAIIQFRTSSAPECDLRSAGAGVYPSECRHGINPRVRTVPPASLPIPSGSAGHRWAGPDFLADYPAITFKVSEAVVVQLRAYAQTSGLTLSEIVTRAVLSFLEKTRRHG